MLIRYLSGQQNCWGSGLTASVRNDICLFVCFWRDSPQWAMASPFMRFLDHTQRRTTVGRTALDEWSARRRDLYLTTHTTHNRHPCPRWNSNPQSQQASGCLRQCGHWGLPQTILISHLTLRLLISCIYGAPCKARNANVVYMWTYVWQRWNSLFLFAAQCFNTESMQRGFLCHICE